MMKMETCEGCGQTLPVEGGVTPEGVELVFREGIYRSPNGDKPQRTVIFTVDPYQEEIHQDSTEHWLCEGCYYEALMDI